jgi:hypothetical protein
MTSRESLGKDLGKSKMLRFPRAAGLGVLLCLLLHLLVPAAWAQFKEIGPPPFSPAVARQRIQSLLDQVAPANRQQTIEKLNTLTPWFRNILDEELTAGWQKDSRERLTLVMEALADDRVAAAVVEFSWRKRTDATLKPSYASLLGHLMARYPESGRAFLSDLLGPVTPELSPSQIETVCRILLDMPDIGTWNESALQILPRYRATAERLLVQDRQGDDQEKSYRAQMWLAQLRGEKPGVASRPSIANQPSITNQPSIAHGRAVSPAPDHDAGPLLFPPPAAGSSNTAGDRGPESTAREQRAQQSVSLAPKPAPTQPLPATAPVSATSATNSPPVQARQVSPVPTPSQPYNGAMSGTLECSGGPVPQNAEYVFRNLPPLKMQLDYDQKLWEARLAPGENQSQRLILKNKSSGPQKRCVVHWSILP